MASNIRFGDLSFCEVEAEREQAEALKSAAYYKL
jgi:hypothetical protein